MSEVITFMGEPLDPTRTDPKSIEVFKDRYDQMAKYMADMYGVPSPNLQPIDPRRTATEIELQQRQALQRLKDMFHVKMGKTMVQQTSLIPPSGSAPTTGPIPAKLVANNKLSDDDAMRLLLLRLRVVTPVGAIINHGFKRLDICQDDAKTYVFVVSAGGATILEDEPYLFPSDALVAQLILLRG